MKSLLTIFGPRWNRCAATAVILLAAAVAVTPQLLQGNSCGHDFDFHLVSWLDCLSSWRHGILYPHWAASANFGAGEPRFIFYPPLTWMLGAALGLILSWPLVPLALTFLLLAATGLATRALAKQALSEGAATLAGGAAIFSGYALFTAYERSAFGELAGGFWIPLLLLFILSSHRPEHASGESHASDGNPRASLWRQAFNGSTAPLALVVAGCWLSNLPLGVMGCYLLAAMALVLALLAKSWAPVLRAAVAIVVGTGLSAIYLVPAAWEQRWVDIRQATEDSGEMIENSWLFGHHADPALALHDVELQRVSLIAVSMIAVALGGVLVCWLRGKMRTENHPISSHWWLLLAMIPPVILLLQLPFSLPLWNLLPKLRFLQFPWRWLVALEAPMAIFFAAAVWPGKPAHRWRRTGVVAVCFALFLAATLFTARSFFQPCDDEDSVAGMMSVYRSGAGFAGTDEYAPPGADNTLVATGLPSACLATDAATALGVLPNGVHGDEAVPVWNATQGSCAATLNWQLDLTEHKRLRGIALHAGTLILRLRRYPAWRVMRNGQLAGDLPRRIDGLIAVPVTQGPIDLTVDWTTTPDVIAGRWFSVLAVLALTGLWLLERKLCQPRLS
jgi:hypothetical protein